MAKHISCDCECKFNSTACNSNQKWNNDKCQCEYKKYLTFEKDRSWNATICICENSRYLKSVVDNSVILCDEIINVTASVSTNVTSTVSIIPNDKKLTCEKKIIALFTLFH